MADSEANKGNVNGLEGKTPFLIGVAGGTASGKVTKPKKLVSFREKAFIVEHSMQKDNGGARTGSYGSDKETSGVHFAG